MLNSANLIGTNRQDKGLKARCAAEAKRVLGVGNAARLFVDLSADQQRRTAESWPREPCIQLEAYASRVRLLCASAMPCAPRFDVVVVSKILIRFGYEERRLRFVVLAGVAEACVHLLFDLWCLTEPVVQS